MFEHFGVMDIWSGLKKYRYVVIIVVVSSILFFVGLNVIKVKNFAKNVYNKNEHIYISSSSYYVEPRIDTLTKYELSVYRSMPDDYIALLNTDFCKQYIYDNLSLMYSNQYIVENSGIGKDRDSMHEDADIINSIKELYWVEKSANSMVLQLSSMTYSQELSRAVVNICQEFLLSNLNNQITTSYLKFSGEADRVIKSTDIFLENIDKEDKRKIVQPSTKVKYSLMSIVKSTVIPIILVVIICVFVIIIIGLINPTINRISDFDEYDVPIIGEVKNYKNFKETK